MIKAHSGVRLTQGTIFTSAKAEDYEGCDVYGMVITARCDIAHDKASVYNYLPVVRFDDWLHRDFHGLLCSRCALDVRESFASFLKHNGIAESVLYAHSPLQLIDTFYPASAADKESKKARDRGMLIAGQIDFVEQIRQEEAPRQKSVLRLSKEFPKQRDDLVKRCVHQTLIGYYFLPDIAPDGNGSGFVVLMREVCHLPRRIAEGLGVGLDGREYASYYSKCDGPLCLSADGFAYAVGCLSSPEIEHLMQVFTLLFGRIGLPDPDSRYITKLWQSQPSIQEDSE